MHIPPDAAPIVRPVETRTTPGLGPVSVMAATEADFQALKTLMGFDKQRVQPLFTANLAVGSGKNADLSLCGPFIGAPLAAMILETLIAWGVDRIIFLGWCGAVADDVQIGDVILPTGAWVDEGTSLHYMQARMTAVSPPERALAKARQALAAVGSPYREGLIWTIDAAFRETREAVLAFQKKGVLAVEMELSALLSVGAFHEVDVVGILVVSDDLSSLTWTPGFKSASFKKGRKTAAQVVKKLIEVLV